MKTFISFVNIPNALSFFRLVSPLPIVVYAVQNDIRLSFCIFMIAVASDFFDGFLARKFNITSKFGAILDPLADKILMTAMYLYFSMSGHIYWLVSAIVIFRDIMIILGIFFLYANKIKIVFSPIVESKINTAVQLIFIVLVYCTLFFKNVVLIVDCTSFFVCCTTLYSGFLYYKLLLKLTRNV